MDRLKPLSLWLPAALWGMALFLLAVSILSPYINPVFFWPPALIGLFFKVWFVLAVAFLVWQLARRRIAWAIASVIVLLFSLPAFSLNFGLGRSKDIKEGKPFRLMTYNVASFGWYKDTAELNTLMGAIADSHPDILCMQEYCDVPTKDNIIEEFMDRQGLRYQYKHITQDIRGPNKVGLAIFSRYPFRNFTPIPFFSTANGAFYVDVKINDDTLRLINTHFQSIGMREREIQITTATEDMGASRKAVLRASLKKLRRAFRKRSGQTEAVAKAIDSSRHKVVLCGDFNDTPLSYNYRILSQRLTDAWLTRNVGLGTTYAGFVPFQRIDYIMVDKRLKIGKCRKVSPTGSDHYPLICDIAF